MESEKTRQVNPPENLEQLQDKANQTISGGEGMDSNSQELQAAAMEIDKLLGLQDEIRQEVNNLLNNSNFNKLLEKYNMSKEAVIKFQCSIELNKIQISKSRENKIINQFIQIIQNQELLVTECHTYWDPNCDIDGCSVTICKP